MRCADLLRVVPGILLAFAAVAQEGTGRPPVRPPVPPPTKKAAQQAAQQAADKAAGQAAKKPAQRPAMETARPAIRVVELQGTPRERGRTHGEALAAEIRELVGRFKQDLQRTFHTDADRFLARFRERTEFEAAASKWTPELIEEIRGIAQGCGIDYDTMFVYQLIDEIWAQGKAVTADKCTTIGLDRCGEQPAVVAQNLDIPKWYHGFQTLLHIVQKKTKKTPRLETFVLTVPGLVGANGMNSARLAVGVNTLLQLQPCTDGLPVAFVVRGVLRHRDWARARAFLYGVRHASGQNYTLGGPDVAHGFECSAGRVRRFEPFAGARHTFHTNHPLVNEEWTDALVARAEKAGKAPRDLLPECPRFAELERRLGRPAWEKAGKAFGLDDVLGALRSKDATVPICNDHTFACTVMLLGPVPELRICAGGADRNEFRVFRFEHLR